MIRIAAALCLIAGVAAAQQTPRYFAAPGHPLTVRAAPDGPPVGELAPGAAPIEVTDFDDSGAWGRIGFGESDAWVAVDALSPLDVALTPYAPLPLGLICAGVEPFWSLRFEADGVIADEPGAAPLTMTPGESVSAQGAAGFPLALRLDALIAVLRPQACADGMSDRTQAWTVDLISQREDAMALRSGCCRLPVRP